MLQEVHQGEAMRKLGNQLGNLMGSHCPKLRSKWSEAERASEVSTKDIFDAEKARIPESMQTLDFQGVQTRVTEATKTSDISQQVLRKKMLEAARVPQTPLGSSNAIEGANSPGLYITKTKTIEKVSNAKAPAESLLNHIASDLRHFFHFDSIKDYHYHGDSEFVLLSCLALMLYLVVASNAVAVAPHSVYSNSTQLSSSSFDNHPTKEVEASKLFDLENYHEVTAVKVLPIGADDHAAAAAAAVLPAGCTEDEAAKALHGYGDDNDRVPLAEASVPQPDMPPAEEKAVQADIVQTAPSPGYVVQDLKALRLASDKKDVSGVASEGVLWRSGSQQAATMPGTEADAGSRRRSYAKCTCALCVILLNSFCVAVSLCPNALTDHSDEERGYRACEHAQDTWPRCCCCRPAGSDCCGCREVCTEHK